MRLFLGGYFLWTNLPFQKILKDFKDFLYYFWLTMNHEIMFNNFMFNNYYKVKSNSKCNSFTRIGHNSFLIWILKYVLYCHLEFVFLIFRIILSMITCVSYFCKISWILILCILTKNLVTVTIIETKIWLIMFFGSLATQWAWMVEISIIWNSLLLSFFVNSKCRDEFLPKLFYF